MFLFALVHIGRFEWNLEILRHMSSFFGNGLPCHFSSKQVFKISCKPQDSKTMCPSSLLLNLWNTVFMARMQTVWSMTLIYGHSFSVDGKIDILQFSMSISVAVFRNSVTIFLKLYLSLFDDIVGRNQITSTNKVFREFFYSLFLYHTRCTFFCIR